MVMKTDPWGEALDAALADGYEAGAHGPVIVVPTPSGRPSPRNSPSSSPNDPG